MKTKLTLLTLLSAFSLQPSALFAQGSLTPPGPPAPTMKSLDQIEARTPISSVPFTISAPGSYYLTGNLSDSLVLVGINPFRYGPSLAGTNAITIAASGVTLDLNGFDLACTLGTTGSGIQINSGLSDITIANGHIRGGVTNNGSGTYSGSGFGSGIYYSGTAPVNVLVSRVSVSGCQNYGIVLNTGDSTVVESCTVRTVGSYGVFASTVKQSSAIDCGSGAIYGDQVSDCRGQSTGSGSGVYASSTTLNCYGSSSSGDGIDAITAQNCEGSSNGSGNGIYADTAQNCEGSSNGGNGIYAFGTAQNCYGYSLSGTGLYAFIASVCHGATTFSLAPLSTPHNVNSY